MKTPLVSVGDVFGMWTVANKASKTSSARWHCECACGKNGIVFQGNLIRGLSRSCGCQILPATIKSNTKHGGSRRSGVTKEYVAWSAMKRRCLNTNTKGYIDYGGRGITISEKFINNFEVFYAEIGPSPGPKMTVGRIDNERGYEPGNIRWETYDQQARNRRNNKLTEDDARKILDLRWKMSQPAVGRMFGVTASMVCAIQRGRTWRGLR